MAAFQRGDEASFDLLVQRYGPGVKGFAARVTGRPETAEEVFVDVFIRLFESAHRWKPSGSFKSFLFTIAYRLCLDVRRKRTRRLRAMGDLAVEPFPPGPGDAGSNPEKAAVLAQRRLALDGAIAELPESHRAAVLLFYRQGMTSREVAEVLGWSDQEVRSRLAYSRRLLRDALDRGGPHGL